MFYKLTFILLYLGAVYGIKYTFLTRIFKVAAVKLLLKTSFSEVLTVPVILAAYDKLYLPATETDMKVGKPSYLIKSMYSSFYQLSYLVRSVGKFMVCLCHCLVKFAQKGGDESNISFESESEGLFISFSFVLVQFCVLLFCLFVFCLVCLFLFFLLVLISKVA